MVSLEGSNVATTKYATDQAAAIQAVALLNAQISSLCSGVSAGGLESAAIASALSTATGDLSAAYAQLISGTNAASSSSSSSSSSAAPPPSSSSSSGKTLSTEELLTQIAASLPVGLKPAGEGAEVAPSFAFALAPPSTVLLLQNMVTDVDLVTNGNALHCSDDSSVLTCCVVVGVCALGCLVCTEEYEDLKKDIMDECSRFGSVRRLVIPRPPPEQIFASAGSGASNEIKLIPADNKDGIGFIFLEYDDIPSCQAARDSLHGRVFNNRTVLATFYPKVKFDAGDYSHVTTSDVEPTAQHLTALLDYFGNDPTLANLPVRLLRLPLTFPLPSHLTLFVCVLCRCHCRKLPRLPPFRLLRDPRLPRSGRPPHPSNTKE